MGLIDKIIFKDGAGKGYGKTSPTHNQSYSVRTDVGALNMSQMMVKRRV